MVLSAGSVGDDATESIQVLPTLRPFAVARAGKGNSTLSGTGHTASQPTGRAVRAANCYTASQARFGAKRFKPRSRAPIPSPNRGRAREVVQQATQDVRGATRRVGFSIQESSA